MLVSVFMINTNFSGQNIASFHRENNIYISEAYLPESDVETSS